MKLSFPLKKIFGQLAFIGGIAGILNGLYFFFGILQWGMREQWHFTYVSGWGFRFLFHLELTVLALLLTAPFLALEKRESIPPLYFPSRKLILSLVGIQLLIFFLAVATETLLQRLLP